VYRCVYDHGDEELATDLSPRQIKSALADSAGRLWIDVQDPSAPATRELLAETFGVDPDRFRAADDRPAIVAAGADRVVCEVVEPGSDPEGEWLPLDLHAGPNFVLALHRGRSPVAERVREALVSDPGRTEDSTQSLLELALDTLLGNVTRAVDSARSSGRRDLRDRARVFDTCATAAGDLQAAVARYELRPSAGGRFDLSGVRERCARTAQRARTARDEARDVLMERHLGSLVRWQRAQTVLIAVLVLTVLSLMFLGVMID